MNMLLTLLFHLISSQTKLISLVGFAIKYENGKQSWNESNFDLQLIGRDTLKLCYFIVKSRTSSAPIGNSLERSRLFYFFLF